MTDKAYAEKYQQAMDSLPGWAKIWMVIVDTVNLVYGAKQAGVSLKQLNNQDLANGGKGTTTKGSIIDGASDAGFTAKLRSNISQRKPI